jgi:acetyl-CoA decarbonylase/synthase complex subunit gamma
MDFSKLTLVTPPRIDSHWSKQDIRGALRVRLSMGRNSYRVDPGLYKLGNPGKEAVVFVTANYKLSFDVLRRNLKGMDAWVLVLQTYGINVWCAAGKGTFGTDELVRQIKDSRLDHYVSHRRVIVPQLGAPGISGHKVKETTGFTVKYGPVRAEDIKEYVAGGLQKDQDMRTVKFELKDRLILAPVEVVNSLRYLLVALVIVVGISGISSSGYSFTEMQNEGLRSVLYLILAYVSGAFLSPVLLPWLPFRHFGGKGLVAGFAAFGMVAWISRASHPSLYFVGWLLLSGAISSFLAMNFTGASTYTSLSGVQKEMRLFIPLQMAFVVLGLASIVVSKFV